VLIVVQRTIRLAIIVSHPIQYYTPVYQRLARRDDIAIKVFFTWHSGQAPIEDRGFQRPIAWDIPLTEGFEFELVQNISSDPGTHHFTGLRNPTLVSRVTAWRPDVIHVTGWAWFSHLQALRVFSNSGCRILFHGDSHLLDTRPRGPRWWIKRAVLQRVFTWPTAFLVVGSANRAYYESFGVKSNRLCPCPHSVDVGRFAEPAERFEEEARQWRREMKISLDQCVILFAGKFERKKRPLELMQAIYALADPSLVLVMVGNGELEAEVNAYAAVSPKHFRVLPFQNQSRMPVVYRLGDLFVLPSAFGESWGIAVNEALACGRPVLVSDRVGCAADVINASCGRVFSWSGSFGLTQALREMDRSKLSNMGVAATKRAWLFDTTRAEAALVACIQHVCLS
jgi:glycosyltransferase involved in cell wall biosynthesis